MTINEYLKRIEKTKSELAKDLRLSRPTLNQYIEIFEAGQKIENERYDIIFNRLFNDESLNKEQFQRRLESVKALLERDSKYNIGDLLPEEADLVARIHNNMIQDLSKEHSNSKIYDFILLLINNYRSNDIIRELACYFSDLNSESDISMISDESKAYYAYFYKHFRVIKDSCPIYDEREYQSFLNRRVEITSERRERRSITTKLIQDRMKKILEKIEREYKEKGVDASEEEMMSEVIRRLKQ